MATLRIIANAEFTAFGATERVKQGSTTDNIETAFEVTVDGDYASKGLSSLADAAGRVLWDSASDAPSTFDVAVFWADQNVDLQIFGASDTHVQRIRAKVPFIIGLDDVDIATGNTSNLAADPTTENITKIFLWNSSGTTVNYKFFLVT